MTGLMLKDFYSLRSYLFKQIGMITVIYLALGWTMKSFVFLSPMLVMSVIMMLVSSFNVDESARWNTYALTLPVTPRMLVGAKYLLFLLALAGTCAAAAGVSCLLDALTFHEGVLTILVSTLAVAALYTFVYAIVLPFLFKFGAEKGRIFITLGFMVPFFALFGWLGTLSEKIDDMDAFMSGLPRGLMGLLALLALCALCAASYFISVRIVESKEY